MDDVVVNNYLYKMDNTIQSYNISISHKIALKKLKGV